MTSEDWTRLQDFLIGQFRLGRWSAHDHEHWRRVELYGMHLGRTVEADLEVVRLFAWLHDSQRHDEGHDPEHGPRAAELARQLCGSWFQLEPERLELLVQACRDHERGRTSTQPTVGACWDADRLDLDRVARVPDERYLSTREAARLARLIPYQRWKCVGIPCK